MHHEPPRLASSQDDHSKVTHFLCASRLQFTIVETRAQRAHHAPPPLPPQGNICEGQADHQQAAPPAQPATDVAPQVLLAPLPPLPVPLATPAFALGRGRSHTVLNFDDPNTGATATNLLRQSSMGRRTTWQSS